MPRNLDPKLVEHGPPRPLRVERVGSEIEEVAFGHVRVRPAPEPFTPFQYRNWPSGLGQIGRGGESRESAPNDDDWFFRVVHSVLHTHHARGVRKVTST